LSVYLSVSFSLTAFCVFVCDASSFIPVIPSFPTRRSSDLVGHRDEALHVDGDHEPVLVMALRFGRALERFGEDWIAEEQAAQARSEEHTSELQSPYDLVCRLLLEKKNI